MQVLLISAKFPLLQDCARGSIRGFVTFFDDGVRTAKEFKADLIEMLKVHKTKGVAFGVESTKGQPMAILGKAIAVGLDTFFFQKKKN